MFVLLKSIWKGGFEQTNLSLKSPTTHFFVQGASTFNNKWLFTTSGIRNICSNMFRMVNNHPRPLSSSVCLGSENSTNIHMIALSFLSVFWLVNKNKLVALRKSRCESSELSGTFYSFTRNFRIIWYDI